MSRKAFCLLETDISNMSKLQLSRNRHIAICILLQVSTVCEYQEYRWHRFTPGNRSESAAMERLRVRRFVEGLEEKHLLTEMMQLVWRQTHYLLGLKPNMSCKVINNNE